LGPEISLLAAGMMMMMMMMYCVVLCRQKMEQTRPPRY